MRNDLMSRRTRGGLHLNSRRSLGAAHSPRSSPKFHGARLINSFASSPCPCYSSSVKRRDEVPKEQRAEKNRRKGKRAERKEALAAARKEPLLRVTTWKTLVESLGWSLHRNVVVVGRRDNKESLVERARTSSNRTRDLVERKRNLSRTD